MSLLGNLTVGILGNMSGLSGSLKASQTEVEKFAKNVDKMGKSISDIGKSMSLLVTGPLLAIGGTSLKAASDFESAFAGVRKTVDATEEEFAMFAQGIRNMAKEMPQSATEIAKVAEAAGQLGIQNDAILGFTKTMVNMGVATNMASDDAAMALARFATITQMNQQHFDRLGATIVGLGNNLAATESEIVEMGLRLAGAGNVIGMTEHQILGFSGALAAVGINAEAGGTAFSKLMINIANAVAQGEDAVQGFAEVAGMSAKDFQKAFKDDAASAIVSFVEGLGGINEAGGNVFAVLEDLGLSEVRLRDALLRASGAGDVMRESLEIGAKAWEENNALTKEAEERYKTFESRMKIFRNRLKDVSITLGNALIPALLSALDAIQPFVDKLTQMAEWFTNLSPEIQELSIVIGSFAMALGPALMFLGSFTQSISNLIPVIGALTSPVGLAVAAIAALAGGLAYLYTTNEEVKESINAAWEYLKSAAEEVWGAVSDFIMEKIEAIKAFWDENGEQFLEAVTNVFNGIKAVVDFVMPAVEWLIEYVWEAIKRIITGALDVIMGAIKIFSGLFTGDFSKMWEGVKQIFKGAIDVILGIMSLQFVGGIRNLLTNLLKTGVNIIRNLSTSIINVFRGMQTTASNIVSGMVNGVINFFRNMFTQASGIFTQLRTFGANTWNAISQSILGVARGIWNGVTTNFSNMFNSIRNLTHNIKATITQIWNDIIAYLRSIDLTQIGKDIIQGLINGIKGMAGAAWDAAKDVAQSIGDSVKNFFGIKSPSRLMMGFGKNIGEGLAIGMEAEKNAVLRAADDLANAALVDLSGTEALRVEGVSGNIVADTVGGTGMNGASEIVVRSPVYLDGELITERVSRIQANLAMASFRGEGAT